MPKSSDIIGYTFNAENFCPDCIIEVLPTGEGEAFDGWQLGAGVQMSTEDNLTEIAHAFQISRTAEHTFDSSEFPKVIFDSMIGDTEECACCGRELGNPDSFPTNPLITDVYHYGNERSVTTVRLRDLRAKLETDARFGATAQTLPARLENVASALRELEVTGRSDSWGWHTLTMEGH